MNWGYCKFSYVFSTLSVLRFQVSHEGQGIYHSTKEVQEFVAGELGVLYVFSF